MTNTTPRLLSAEETLRQKIAKILRDEFDYIGLLTDDIYHVVNEHYQAQQSLTTAEYQAELENYENTCGMFRHELREFLFQNGLYINLADTNEAIISGFHKIQQQIKDDKAKLQSSHQAKIEELFQEIEDSIKFSFNPYGKGRNLGIRISLKELQVIKSEYEVK